ncbi:MAG: hypothetical protein WA765_04075 [Candidatus Acidiferrum sp.]
MHIENEPGVLETFLITTPNAVLTRKLLGTLTSPDGSEASLTAIVAENRISKKKAKGLEVCLKGGGTKASAYIDEDALLDLAQSLRSMVGDQRFILAHPDRYGPGDYRKPTITSAINRSPTNGEFYSPLEIGFYLHEAGFGVYASVPPGGRHGSAQIWLQNTDISQVISLVASGRAFLAAN